MAAALAGGGFALTEAPTKRQAAPSIPLLGKYLAIVLVLLVIAIELFLVIRSINRNDLQVKKRRNTWTSLAFLAAGFLAAYLIKRSGHLHITRPQKVDPVKTAKTQADHAKNAVSHSSQALGIALTVILALLIIALVAGTIYMWRAGRGRGAPRTRLQRDLAADLAAAEIDLETIADPRAAVLACYDRMQSTLARGGLPGSPSDTPVELVRRVREVFLFRGDAPERLAALFEHAKFSHHPVTEEMRGEALAAVGDIRGQLAEDPEREVEGAGAP